MHLVTLICKCILWICMGLQASVCYILDGHELYNCRA